AAVQRFQEQEVDVPADTLMVHGEQDEVVPLSETLDWARPRDVPVVVVPGASHFFHGELLVLRALVNARLEVALDGRAARRWAPVALSCRHGKEHYRARAVLSRSYNVAA